MLVTIKTRNQPNTPQDLIRRSDKMYQEQANKSVHLLNQILAYAAGTLWNSSIQVHKPSHNKHVAWNSISSISSNSEAKQSQFCAVFRHIELVLWKTVAWKGCHVSCSSIHPHYESLKFGNKRKQAPALQVPQVQYRLPMEKSQTNFKIQFIFDSIGRVHIYYKNNGIQKHEKKIRHAQLFTNATPQPKEISSLENKINLISTTIIRTNSK